VKTSSKQHTSHLHLSFFSKIIELTTELTHSGALFFSELFYRATRIDFISIFQGL